MLLELFCFVPFGFDEPNELLLELEGETYTRVREMRHTLLSIQRTWRTLGYLGRSAVICMLAVSLESSTPRIGSLQSCNGFHAAEFVDVEDCVGSARYFKLESPWIDAPTTLSPSSLPQTSEETSKRGNARM